MSASLVANRRVHRFWDSMAPGIAKFTAREGRPITCRGAGCFACCYEPVQSSEGEARLIIAAVLRDQGEAGLEELRSRVRQWLERAQEAGQLVNAEPDAFAYRAASLRCPLLGANQRCSVYAERPLSCRAHIATGDPDACFDDERRKTQQYCYAPEVLVQAMAREAGEGAETLEMVGDMLGVWLAELLLPHEELSWNPQTGPATRMKGTIQLQWEP